MEYTQLGRSDLSREKSVPHGRLMKTIHVPLLSRRLIWVLTSLIRPLLMALA